MVAYIPKGRCFWLPLREAREGESASKRDSRCRRGRTRLLQYVYESHDRFAFRYARGVRGEELYIVRQTTARTSPTDMLEA